MGGLEATSLFPVGPLKAIPVMNDDTVIAETEMRYWMCHWQIRNWRNEINTEGERLNSAFSSQFWSV